MAKKQRHSTSYYETLQKYADEYLEEVGDRATTTDMATWALSTGRWYPPHDLILRACRIDFARAMREQYIKDDFGRSVRAKHAARVPEGGTQKTFWTDIRKATPDHMTNAFQQRREQIVGECCQLGRDQQFYNSLHPEEPIQLEFDFRDDVMESQFSGEYPKR